MDNDIIKYIAISIVNENISNLLILNHNVRSLRYIKRKIIDNHYSLNELLMFIYLTRLYMDRDIAVRLGHDTDEIDRRLRIVIENRIIQDMDDYSKRNPQFAGSKKTKTILSK